MVGQESAFGFSDILAMPEPDPPEPHSTGTNRMSIVSSLRLIGQRVKASG
jgi:hypothetical protein